jgi:lipooligosaccharide transport system ATP-binding protein
MKNVIEVRNLVKKFGDITAVDDISFFVSRSRCIGLLGPNGAGKTSTVRVLECVSPATGGEAHVLGEQANLSARAVRKRIGVVPQENDLDPDLTVWQNLILFSKFFDIPRREARQRIDDQLKFMELFERRFARIDELSGGMKRRLLVARALINDPEILMLDEPSTGLDPQMRHMIWQRLRALKKRGLTMVLTTHYMDEAEQLCDDVIIMDKGKILRMGSPQRLIQEMAGDEIIEVRNFDDQKNVKNLLSGLGYKMDVFGDTMYISRGDHADIFRRLLSKKEFTVLRRPATLEDVFLQLTGRGLNE